MKYLKQLKFKKSKRGMVGAKGWREGEKGNCQSTGIKF